MHAMRKGADFEAFERVRVEAHQRLRPIAVIESITADQENDGMSSI
jgi:hypothetical protein